MPASRNLRILFALLAAAFFATPLALRAVGIRARAFENRRFAAAPRVADGWNFFDEATRFLIDRLPLRYQAVRANTWIDQHVFAQTPQYGLGGLGGVASDQALAFAGQPLQDRQALTSGAGAGRSNRSSTPPPTAAQVAIGRDGWLFLQGAIDRDCSPFISWSEATSRWEDLLAVIRASGRRTVLVIPPDKETIYPEFVAPGTPNLACANLGAAAMWRHVESPAARAAGIVGLRQPLLSQKSSGAPLLYYRTDSHWNSVGSLTFPEAALPAVSSTVQVLPGEIVTEPSGPYTGDLLGLLGETGKEIAPARSIRRRPGAPVLPGSSVVVGDSYADAAMPQLTPYFASIRLLEWVTNTTDQIVQGIVDSRTVILETVEREFDYRATDSAYITPAFIARVRAALAAHRLPGG